MIITLIGADFSANNIGTLSTWSISRSIGTGATYDGPTFVDKDAAFSATVTIADGYELGATGVTVTMGGVTQSGAASISGNTVTISISSVTGAVVIKVPTKNASTGEEDSGGSETPDTQVKSGTLALQQKMLSVVSGENFYITNIQTKRMTSASSTEATGILIKSGQTITLTGVSGLRFDYIYADNAGPAHNDKTAWGAVGAASQFVSANYFPFNTDGSQNSVTVTNTHGQDYYFFFAFAAPDKTTEILVSNYTITWVIS